MHRKLIIDIGNTLQKLAVFEDKKLIFKETTENLNPSFLSSFIDKNGPFRGIMQSSVVIHRPETEEILSKSGKFMLLTEYTPIPVKNLYHTPESLGKDRLAGAIGAWSLFPGRNILVIDAGTCMTFDMINHSGEYLGGAISPGIRMRFKAMNTFTGKLPLIEPEDYDGLVGRSTRESLLSGVYNGIAGEIRETVRQYHELYEDLAVIITGGDSEFLHNKLKINIFAAPDLVLLGLNEILDYNDLQR